METNRHRTMKRDCHNQRVAYHTLELVRMNDAPARKEHLCRLSQRRLYEVAV